ncbi:MAG: hypothetical protein P4L84_38060 [Isosphaeraceae bacterium]|nr:hypothetical protein [Isosphaeraceae bacterium]
MRHELVLLGLIAAWTPQAALAQRPPEPTPTAIVLRPAAEPRPALKYRLVPERSSLVPGNAAIFYHRAIQLALDRRMRFAAEDRVEGGARTETVDEQIANWVSGPIAKLPRQEARKQLDAFEAVLREIELGAARSTCDWELDQRQEGYSLLLPEIQEMRSLARLVALRSKLAILDGKPDEAMHWIEIGLVMGRHVSDGPNVIQALVGVAIDFVALRCLDDLIQVPGAPNLFWALADAPRPFIDMRHALEGERHLIDKELPGLNELDEGPWSLDRARRFADELQRKLFALTSSEPIGMEDSGTANEMAGLVRRLGIAAMSAKIYPEAKKALITQGRPAVDVEAMPVIQVAVLYSVQEYQRLLDEAYKWIHVPYWQSYDKVDHSIQRSADQKLANPLLAMFQTLIPGLNAVRLAAIRLDRQLDALQCIEAIRLYAAAHGGTLPPSLEVLQDAPAPIDPLTGKLFSYSVDGDSATLSAPLPPGGPNHPNYALRYVLKLAR